jgi:hypothetical protein
LICVPIVALGMNPGVVHADGPSTVWKVLIHEEGIKIMNGGWSAKVNVTYTCPKSATGVVIDLTIHQSLDNPVHESEGEIDNAPVTCKGEAADKWLTVWADGSEDPFIARLAALKASLDAPPRSSPWDGHDMASDNRTARLGDSNDKIEWVSIKGGEVKNGGTQVKVLIDYLCSSSKVAADMRAYVDQDLGISHEGGSGDAEGLATKSSVPCTGHRESTSVLVTSGLPTTPTEGSAPCEDQFTPAPTNGSDEFTPENGGTFAGGLACIQIQFGDAVAGDVVAAQEGVFRLDT